MVTSVKVNPVVRWRTAVRSQRPLVSQGGEYAWTEEGPEYTSKIAAEQGRKAIVRERGRVVALVEYKNGVVQAIYVRNAHRYFQQG
jgi:hypothetical protein